MQKRGSFHSAVALTAQELLAPFLSRSSESRVIASWDSIDIRRPTEVQASSPVRIRTGRIMLPISQKTNVPKDLENVSIETMTESVLDQFETRIKSSNIRVDKDLQPLHARVDARFIRSAVAQLIENAIDSMPGGGELQITLIDCDNCWELEIADSAPTEPPTQPSTPQSLPKLLPLDQGTRLESVRREALAHGGQVQTWDCPQGGTANVLVIPRRTPRPHIKAAQ